MFGFRRRSPGNNDERRDEPRTVREAQVWLHHNGFGEVTETIAGNLLAVRRQVREGALKDE